MPNRATITAEAAAMKAIEVVAVAIRAIKTTTILLVAEKTDDSRFE